ncbi:hypothetical protein [Pseudomonas nitroreducens]|uniref:hypothetical protein n=1 Tax=Pseudomonas nitroreducens TaxID=46680 RepID=UPI0018F01736|nr:hypothetical protein [Pseudomonas nitroreducens]
MGHADGEMTTYYQEGHEEKAIEYQRVRADLKLQAATAVLQRFGKNNAKQKGRSFRIAL